MKITLELKAGPYGSNTVSVEDIEKNIQAQKRAINNELLAGDFVLLTDTKSILIGIQKEIGGLL